MLVHSWLGTLPAWLTLASVLIGAFLIWRGGGGSALDVLQTANQVLERRVRDLEQQGKTDASLIAELKGKTDVALAVQPFMRWAELHERRAAERHDASLAVLGMIADRLGPEHHDA